MDTRLKFHAIAIVMIIIIVSCLYVLFGPKKVQPMAAGNGGIGVEITSATWGENCNSAIADALAERQRTALPTDAAGNVIAHKPLQPIEYNNALAAVQNLCNGRPTCEFRVNSEILGNDPMDNCFKRLAVSYRCSNFDPLTSKTISQNDVLLIDCLTKNTDATKTKAP